MNKKTMTAYLVGTVAGLSIAMGSVVYAQDAGSNNIHRNTNSMGQMGTQGNNTMGHGNQTSMHGQVPQSGMHNQAAKMSSRGNMHDGSAAHHAFFENQTSVHDETS